MKSENFPGGHKKFQKETLNFEGFKSSKVTEESVQSSAGSAAKVREHPKYQEKEFALSV
jgi:hypothetical protein